MPAQTPVQTPRATSPNMPAQTPAQTTAGNGAITGTVLSSTGTPIANATVEVHNVTTDARQTTITDSAGTFRFDNLPPGTYRMSTRTGTLTGTPSQDILISADRGTAVTVTMQNAANTTAGATTALITVQETRPIEGLATPQIISTHNTRDIEYLPTPDMPQKNGEIYGSYDLSLTAPGVATNGGVGPGRGPVVGGQRPVSNDFLVEGVDNNNRVIPGPLVYIPNTSTTEFVQYDNQFPPEYGHAMGGQFNNIVRTGTNQLHGSMYWLTQNRNMNAEEPSFSRMGLFGMQRYDQNRVGGSVGMPIIPNHLFFWGSFEYIPLGVSNAPLTPVFGPTAAGFAALGNISGVSATNLGVLRRYLPAAPNATRFTSVGGQQIPIGPLQFTGKDWQNSYFGTGGLDFNFWQSDQLRFRYVHNYVEGNSNGATLPSFLSGLNRTSLLANISEYHNFSSRAVNELRLAYTRFTQNVDNPTAVFPGLTVFPNISIQQDLNAQLGQGFFGVNNAGVNTYQLTDNVHTIFGSHTIRFGYDGRRYISPLNYAWRGFGTYGFSNLQGFLFDQSPDVFGSRAFGNTTYSGNEWDHYAYINDAWRVRPNFNINLGVRYEYVTIPQTLQLQGLNGSASVPGVLSFNTPQPQEHNFAPRIGVAFSPTNMRNTVFRAGFGMNYDAQAYANAASLLPTVPPGTVSTQFANVFEPFFGFFGAGGIVSTVPFNQFNPSVTPEQARAMTTTYIGDQRLPYTMQWNANLQQTFGRILLDIGYLGVRARDLPVQTVLNRTPVVTATQNLPLFYSAPTQAQLNALPLTLDQLRAMPNNPLASAGFTSPIYSMVPAGKSNYDGLLVRGTQRFAAGLQLQASYTWSHLMDNMSGPNLLGNTSLGWMDYETTRHSSVYDHRQIASLTALWDIGGIGANRPNWFRDVVANMVLSGVYTYQSGAPLLLTSGLDAGLSGGFNGNSGVIMNSGNTSGLGSGVTPLRNGAGQIVAYQANNPNAQFIRAAPGLFTNGGVNSLRMNPINDFDASLSKTFALRDRFSIELRGDAMNVLNHPQFTPGNLSQLGLGNTASYNFLIPGNALFGDLTQAFSAHPRVIQAGLRILF